jgi:hypothetical protein
MANMAITATSDKTTIKATPCSEERVLFLISREWDLG